MARHHRAPAAPRVGFALAHLFCLLAAGCVTMKPPAAAPGPEARVLEGVPLQPFTARECGAGSLAAVLAFLGDPVSAARLDAELPKAANGGVLSLDMLLAARARGFKAELIEGSGESVARLIDRGLPAILMLRMVDAPGARRDLYHYVVVDGADHEGELIRVHFGDGVPRWVPWRRLERPWRGAGHALLVIRPGPADRAPRSPELVHAVALEEEDRSTEAVALYEKLLAEEPDSPLLWTNLGNAAAEAGSPERAEAAYRRALALAPEDRDALNNLAWLLLEQGRADEALPLAQRGAGLGGADRWYRLETLGRAQRSTGDCAGAIATYEAALAEAPPDDPAVAWLHLGLGLALRDCCRPGEAAEHLERATGQTAIPEARREAAAALEALWGTEGGSKCRN